MLSRYVNSLDTSMTSNVSSTRRSEPIHVPKNDQIMGSFDGMPVKVVFSTTRWFTSLQNNNGSRWYAILDGERQAGLPVAHKLLTQVTLVGCFGPLCLVPFCG